ncbi:DUF6252 family protein [Mucilaginibacter sp.]|uniref:DUF6252 family protein n=1 Tax=Mucilaginibacter sp. TaxID=1882438 RepID=UPI00284BFF49|nr:DUF6252 family protein [Mucilaginibacter sp.]MDR3695576.1 DUF6252 family protein [Mucilaginibacter sp.]
MKSLKWAFLAFTLFAFTLNSCKKSASNKPAVTNSIALKFNGTAYSTSTITAAYKSGALQIIGSYVGGTTLYLAIPGNVKVGSFDLSTGAGAATFSTGPSASFFSDSGSIVITSFTSTTVAGTFSFHGTDLTTSGTCTVTEGTFQATYATQ